MNAEMRELTDDELHGVSGGVDNSTVAGQLATAGINFVSTIPVVGALFLTGKALGEGFGGLYDALK